MKFVDKEVAEHLLKDAAEDNHFKVKDGSTIKNLNELYLKTGSIDDESFKHHVSEGKNDFANWVHHVVGDTHLAKKISNSKDKHELHKHVRKRISYLNSLKHFTPKGYGIRMFLFGLLAGYILGTILIYVT